MIHRHGGSERWRRLLVCMYDGNVTAGFRLPTVDKYLGSLDIGPACATRGPRRLPFGYIPHDSTRMGLA